MILNTLIIKAIHHTKIVQFFFLIAFIYASSSFAQEDHAYSVSELNEAFQTLPQPEQTLVAELSEQDRLRYLTIIQTRLVQELRAEEQRPDLAPANGRLIIPERDTSHHYKADPLLIVAFEAYEDETRPSSDAITLFDYYIDSNPDSPFLGEVYFRIGSLYSIHRRSDETPRFDLQLEYYSKAHEIWGDGFSYLNNTAWGSLANRSDNLRDRKDYYDWLVSFEQGTTPEQMITIREIGQVFNGRQPEIDSEDLSRISEAWTGNNLLNMITSAESNILYWARNNPAALLDLVTSYPNRRLGRLASKQLSN